MKLFKNVPVLLDLGTKKGRCLKDNKPIKFTPGEFDAVIAVELGMTSRRGVAFVMDAMNRVRTLQHLPERELKSVNLDTRVLPVGITSDQVGFLLHKARRKLQGDLPFMDRTPKKKEHK